MHVGIHDVDAVFVGECRVGAFPGCDTAAAVAERDGGLLYPGCAEAVEEIGFSCYFAVFEVSVA